METRRVVARMAWRDAETGAEVPEDEVRVVRNVRIQDDGTWTGEVTRGPYIRPSDDLADRFRRAGFCLTDFRSSPHPVYPGAILLEYIDPNEAS